jgi:hypothetical protein
MRKVRLLNWSEQVDPYFRMDTCIACRFNKKLVQFRQDS